MLKYIATREGVDLTPLSSSRFQRLDNDEVANLRYIHQRPRSHGLFGNLPDAEIDDLDGLCKKMYKISNRTPVYNIILSLKEEDAIPLGYDKKQAWADLLHASMPDVAQSLGIPITQLSWVAAYHQEKGHPHIHGQFWRNDGKIQSSYIPQDRPNKCKEIFSSYIFSPYRPEIIVQKTRSRDVLIDMTKEVMGFIPGAASGGGIMGHLKNEFLIEFTNDLIELSKVLPEDGKIKYMYLSLELKQITNNIVGKLLSTPAFASEYQNFQDKKTRLSKSYSVGHDKAATQMTEAERDIQKRMANVILKKALSIRISGIIEPTPDPISFKNDVPENYYDTELLDYPQHDWEELNPTEKNYSNEIKMLAETQIHDIDYLKQVSNWKNESTLYKLANKYLFSWQDAQPDNPPLPNIDKLISSLEDIGKNEDPQMASKALYYLGRIFQKKDGAYYDMNRGISSLMKSSHMDNKNALFQLAKTYIFTPEKDLPDFDINSLKSLLTKFIYDESSKAYSYNDIAQAKYYYGLINLKESPAFNLDEGIHWLEAAANEHNMYAQASLGSIYLFGKYGIKDIDLGKKWLEKSVGQGNGYAKEQLDLNEKISSSNFIYLGYSLSKNLFDALFTLRHQSTDISNCATRSKKLQKEINRKNPYKSPESDLE